MLTLNHQCAGHLHGVVVRVAAHETQNIVGRFLPDLFEGLAGERVEAAERLIEKQDISVFRFHGKFGHDQAGFATITGGKAAVGFLDIQLDPAGEGEGRVQAGLRQHHPKDQRRSDGGVEAQVFGEILKKARGAKISGERLLGPSQRAKESRLAPTVPGEQEMSAAT